MTRSGRNQQADGASGDQSVSNRQNVGPLERAAIASTSHLPVRTVIYVEVGDMIAADVRTAIQNIRQQQGDPFHPTFFIPVRHGRPAGGVEFEADILDMVNKLCEIKDGQIVLRGGATTIDIVHLSV